MAPHLPDAMRELHSRVNDGIHVRLLWDEKDGGLAVAVKDSRTGETFAVPVGAGDRALHVFNHPFAYAAQRRVYLPPPTAALEHVGG